MVVFRRRRRGLPGRQLTTSKTALVVLGYRLRTGTPNQKRRLEGHEDTVASQLLTVAVK